MFTNDEKKNMVEYGIKKFKICPEFLEWLIDEFNNIYLENEINNKKEKIK